MSIKTTLARVFAPIERRIDLIKGEPDGRMKIDAYAGYETPEGVVLRGRVLAVRKQPVAEQGQGILENITEFARLFMTDEVEGVTLCLDGTDLRATSDEEGYFSLAVPEAIRNGAQEMSLTVEGESDTTRIRIFDVPEDARLGVISDIDDTMMRTGAYSLMLNLWTTISGNIHTREIFKDAIELMTRLHAEKNPIFYVSSSPWNMHDYLVKVFERHGLPLGPLFLRDLGLDENKFITGTHGGHKGSAIQTILDANPDLPFVLIGDTGQHDPQIYAGIITADPGRFRAAIFRQPGPGANHEAQAAMERIRAVDVPVFTGPDYSDALANISRITQSEAAG